MLISWLGARHSSAPGVWLIRSAFPFVFKLDRRNRSPRSLLVSIHLLNENLSSTPSCRLSRRSLGGAGSARAATYAVPQLFSSLYLPPASPNIAVMRLKNGLVLCTNIYPSNVGRKCTCLTKAMSASQARVQSLGHSVSRQLWTTKQKVRGSSPSSVIMPSSGP